MSRRRWNVVFPKDGKSKTRWVRIGTAFENEDGRIDVHIDAWPVGEFDGKIYLFIRTDERELEPGAVEHPPPRPQAGERAPEARGGFKMPENYVHRVHMKSPEHPYKGLCWAWAKKGNTTDDWEKVTCKRCLGLKPPPASPAA
jgi:hypothetical protein